jgi:hypothetical protein
MQSTTTEHTCPACGGTDFKLSIYRSAALGSAIMVFCASSACEKRHDHDMVCLATGDTLA